MEKELEIGKEEQENKAVSIVVKKKRNRRGRLILLFLMLLFTGVMLSTSTYAWFTSNKTVNVNNINVNVTAQNGIQISTDGTTWKSIIQTTDITTAINNYTAAVNQLPSTMEPVSTAGVVDTSGKMEMYYGTIAQNADGQSILTAVKDTEVNGTTGKFVAFDLFFKVDQDVTNLYMNAGSGVVADGTDVGIKNASRIAFVNLGNVPAGSDLSTIQAINNGSSSVVEIWEPNYDVHKATGVTNAFDTYQITTTETGAAQIPYYGVTAPIADTDNQILLNTNNSNADTNFFSAITTKYATTEGQSTAFEIFDLAAGITKMRIYMWIEGQDVDCENNASGGNITYNLQISIID